MRSKIKNANYEFPNRTWDGPHVNATLEQALEIMALEAGLTGPLTPFQQKLKDALGSNPIPGPKVDRHYWAKSLVAALKKINGIR